MRRRALALILFPWDALRRIMTVRAPPRRILSRREGSGRDGGRHQGRREGADFQQRLRARGRRGQVRQDAAAESLAGKAPDARRPTGPGRSGRSGAQGEGACNGHVAFNDIWHLPHGPHGAVRFAQVGSDGGGPARVRCDQRDLWLQRRPVHPVGLPSGHKQPAPLACTSAPPFACQRMSLAGTGSSFDCPMSPGGLTRLGKTARRDRSRTLASKAGPSTHTWLTR